MTKKRNKIDTLKDLEAEQLRTQYESLLIKQRLLMRWLIIKSELAPERLLASLITSLLGGLKEITKDKEN